MASYGDIYESITHRDNSPVHLEHKRRAALVGLEKNAVTVNYHVTHVSSEESTVRSPAGERKVTEKIPVQKCKQLQPSRRLLNLTPVFHPVWPFLHKGTFDPLKEPRLIVQSVLMIGLWIDGRKEERAAAIELHRRLRAAINAQRVSSKVHEI